MSSGACGLSRGSMPDGRGLEVFAPFVRADDKFTTRVTQYIQKIQVTSGHLRFFLQAKDIRPIS